MTTSAWTRSNLAAIALLLALPASAARLVVLKGDDAPRLASALASLQSQVAGPVEVVTLPPEATDAELDPRLVAERDTMIVALGPRASDYAMRLPATVPVVHCLAGADALRAGRVAIASEAPAGEQAAWLAKLVPSARTVALLFDPARNSRRAEALAAGFQAAGYGTLLRPVRSPSELPAALDAVAGSADVLVALPDPTVYTREAARGILLFSFRKGIPLVGPNDAWVRMGALYSLDWDYREVGAACARLAEGRSDASPPLRPRVSVNMKSAARFGIAWDPSLVKAVDARHE